VIIFNLGNLYIRDSFSKAYYQLNRLKQDLFQEKCEQILLIILAILRLIKVYDEL